MVNVRTYSFCRPFIEQLADEIEAEYLDRGADLSRLGIVFGGKRPQLFLQRELARRIGRPFIPPRFLTIDQLVTMIIERHERFGQPPDLDNSYLIYRIVREHTPDLLKGREAFYEFLPWAKELMKFIDQIDLENVADRDLTNLEEIAKIGFAVPEDINRLLAQIVGIRRVYHQELKAAGIYSRGYQYRRAAALVEETPLDEFDELLFCNFFYFNRSEEQVVRALSQRGQARFYFQGDQRRWPILKRLAERHSWEIKEGATVEVPQFHLNLYAAFDVHSQVGTIREILKKIDEPEKTVIVLPTADNIVPLLSEISGLVREFNISMGYPLKRSSLYTLFELIFRAQQSCKDGRYYARDYLRVLLHPFCKNFRLSFDAEVTRIMAHKLQDMLSGREEGAISGLLFLDPDQVLECDDLFVRVQELILADHPEVRREKLAADLDQLHHLLFRIWEGVRTFSGFAKALAEFLDAFLRYSSLKRYPLNLNIANQIFQILEEFRSAAFSHEVFPQDELFKVFEQRISSEIVAFIGSPLKGMQLLGLFETRSLNFDHVIVMDVNEGVLPNLVIHEPLIPRDVMITLGLNRVELDEEIQRYQFMRLISSAKDVHLIYQQNKEKERSRFVEELVWEEQKKARSFAGTEARVPTFHVAPTATIREVPKTPEMIAMLREHRYSASSVNLYLRNPLEFYHRYVLGLREAEDLLDEPEARQIGTFVHNFLEKVFRPYEHRRPDIDAGFIKDFTNRFEKDFDDRFSRSMKSDSFLLRSVVRERLRRFIQHEQESPDRQVEEILGLEQRFDDSICLADEDLRFVYVVDRIDRLRDGTVMILDYKTGGQNVLPKKTVDWGSVEPTREAIAENVKSFQIPLYFHYLLKTFPGQRINAALYNLRTLAIDPLITDRTKDSYENIDGAFMRLLDAVMAEILDINVNFVEDRTRTGSW